MPGPGRGGFSSPLPRSLFHGVEVLGLFAPSVVARRKANGQPRSLPLRYDPTAWTKGPGRVSDAVEATRNPLPGGAADAFGGARGNQRSPGGTHYRAGSSTRRLHANAGKVGVVLPKPRRAAFESRVSSGATAAGRPPPIGALVGMDLAGVSVRGVEPTTEALGGRHIGPRTVNALKQEIYARIPE